VQLQGRGISIEAGLRRFSAAAFHPLGRLLARFLTPNLITASSLLASGAVGWCFAVGRFVLGAWLMLVAGLLDIFDGQVAKLTNRVSVFGAFLDSTVDRVSDYLYAVGVIYYFIHFRDASGGTAYDLVYLVLAYLFVSQIISYIKARAEALGFACNVGLLARPLRMLLFGVPLFIYGLKPELWVLRAPLIAVTALGAETALHRFAYVWRQAARGGGDAAAADPAVGKEEEAG
jgi:CDP-diacylglycerol--glycerol-3-phosphate 3-phosphatidyltransferase